MIIDPKLNEPMESLFKNVDVRTFIVWNASDRVLHPGGAKVIRSIIINSQVTVIKDVGHVPMIEIPERTGKLFLEFLKSS
ncbi:MAG: alpha/beta hydrolase [Desulfobacteraceae bacterium]|nr:alpha/beta hydrolase [Desulfobacteraceae bacterium]